MAQAIFQISLKTILIFIYLYFMELHHILYGIQLATHTFITFREKSYSYYWTYTLYIECDEKIFLLSALLVDLHITNV